MATESMYRPGIAAFFGEETALPGAVRELQIHGTKIVEVYSPHPIAGLGRMLGIEERLLPWVVLVFAFGGAAFAFAIQSYSQVIDYPINIAGRPLFSWQSFIPVTFEIGILSGSAAAVAYMLLRNGLPRPHQREFDIPGFDRVSQDQYALIAETGAQTADLDEVLRICQSAGATRTHVLEWC